MTKLLCDEITGNLWLAVSLFAVSLSQSVDLARKELAIFLNKGWWLNNHCHVRNTLNDSQQLQHMAGLEM